MLSSRLNQSIRITLHSHFSRGSGQEVTGIIVADQPEFGETKQHARQRPRSAQAIGDSEEWLFTTLESIGDAVIATNVDGLIVFMNPVAVQLTGWSQEEGESRTCREVFHIVNETTRLETESPVAKVLRDGRVAGLANHTILIARDGTERSIDDSGSPIRDKAGALIGVVLIFRDITAKRKADLTVQEQKDILQTLFDHLPVIVSFLDENERFQWVNREWTRAVGWTLEEMRDPGLSFAFFSPSAPMIDTVPVADGLRPRDAETALQARAALGWRRFTVHAKDGRSIDLSWTTVQLSDGTHIGIGQDMTQQQSQEAESLRFAAVEARNLRLEQAMKETDHRVKNNLQSVAALLDIQVMSHADAVPVQELAQVRLHINMLASIHEMLIQDVKDKGMATSLSIKAQMQKLLPMLQQLVGKERIVWSVEDVQLPVKQGMSLAVLINELVSNAVKHGGNKVQLELSVAEQNITLEVCDDGPGFTEAFDPKKAANFGLELVESVGRLDLGGHTFYNNRPGGGACVRVTFPLPVGAAA